MPKALHDKLAKEAREKGLEGKEADAYVYGTLAKVDKQVKALRSKKSSHSSC